MTREELAYFADMFERIEALLIEIRDEVSDLVLAQSCGEPMPDISGLESDVSAILDAVRPQPKRKPRSRT